MGEHCPPAGCQLAGVIAQGGKASGKEEEGQLLGDFHLSCCCSGNVLFPFLSIHKHFLELFWGSSLNRKEEAKPHPLSSPLPWGAGLLHTLTGSH